MDPLRQLSVANYVINQIKIWFSSETKNNPILFKYGSQEVYHLFRPQDRPALVSEHNEMVDAMIDELAIHLPDAKPNVITIADPDYQRWLEFTKQTDSEATRMEFLFYQSP